MQEFRIEVPQYVTRIKTSETRRKKYYLRGEDLPVAIETALAAGDLKWKKDRVYDPLEKDYLIRNARTQDKPNYILISGNEIYARMHERKRMMIVKGIKDSLKPYLSILPSRLDYPVSIEMILHCPPKSANWDLDNLWIYFKCFQDLIVDEGFLPDDNIMYITKSTAITYIPCKNEDDRKMIFIIKPDRRPELTAHNLYDRTVKQVMRSSEKILTVDDGSVYLVVEDNIGKPGTLLIDNEKKEFHISTGKKARLASAVRKALGHVYSHSIQLNCSVAMYEDLYVQIGDAVKEQLIDRGTFVILIVKNDSGNKVLNSA